MADDVNAEMDVPCSD
uniref:Uncharacterized protein n=1 Tax=Arundo donax TaxID=35708 RepID=A0A0A9FQU2_ARUDO